MSMMAICITLTVIIFLAIGCYETRAINNYPEFRLLRESEQMSDFYTWPWQAQREINKLRTKIKMLHEAKESFILMDFTAACNKVSRFEVIDHTSTGTGRDLVKYGVNVTLGYQDDGKTLKVFLTDKEE